MRNTTKPQFLLAAPSSGSGKTSISIGLMKLLTQRGKRVQPFKCGPDYIDTKFHELATGKPSVNLDTFMASESHVKDLYATYSQENDVCIIEGVMGMFDGYDRYRGSSAEIAQLLNIPVILVVDARSTAYSVTPLLYGFTRFNPDIQVAGVIFNCVGSDTHEQILREACTDIDIECLGCIRRNKDLQLSSRYLGLDISVEENKKIVETWSNFMANQLDVERLLEKTQSPTLPYTNKEKKIAETNVRIAVARNKESFAFIYQETIERMNQLGEIIYFDPEIDTHLPNDIDLLYLPGGYPEKRIKELKNNNLIYKDIQEYIEAGGRTFAECGGMIYLSKYIDNEEGRNHMVNIFPFTIVNTSAGRKLTLGYRQFEYNGQKIKGHEFHYTQIAADCHPLCSITQVHSARNMAVNTPVFRYKNAIASYTHIYWGEIDIWKLWD